MNKGTLSFICLLLLLILNVSFGGVIENEVIKAEDINNKIELLRTTINNKAE